MNQEIKGADNSNRYQQTPSGGPNDAVPHLAIRPGMQMIETEQPLSKSTTMTSLLWTHSTAPTDHASQKDPQDMAIHSNTLHNTAESITSNPSSPTPPIVYRNSLPTETAMAKTLRLPYPETAMAKTLASFQFQVGSPHKTSLLFFFLLLKLLPLSSKSTKQRA